ncbi:MAG: 50S ribosomal protein L35 [Candidatus Nealsonbacteria bacterium CG09_land_8_20_14_0_10_42_14]|uniref:Large ribosomal subunit protein bL35 n=1 Tax=Candidatus Nealsonbacteria bacterium CG09_land_8_20_14_0_10_42_14 TaxID=1974707 RepID=A0A2H0WXS9_9BACT|nr:MAG: 50S ribosomal protein L35 [Candidatus Nealsonbacteria bacterium CG09_land_8_20_14_0_10_42_14]
MKTRKSILKRFKVTRTGKVMRRVTGQDHLRAKKTGQRRRAGRKWVEMTKSDAKKIRRLLSS